MKVQGVMRYWLHVLVLAILFSVVWFVFSGYTEYFFIGCGVFSVVVVLLLIARMKLIREDYSMYRMLVFSLNFVRYLLKLLADVVNASLGVTKIIWSSKLNIDPTISCICTTQDTDAGKLIYANSITLTPGTIAIMLEEKKFLVHSLFAQDIKALSDSKLDFSIAKMVKK